LDQLTFKDVEIGEKQARIKILSAELERRLKAVALSIDRQIFSAVNDKSYSYMSEILNTNNEDAAKPYQVKFIPSLTIENPKRFKEEVIDFLCELCGYSSPEKKKDLTPEEELTLIKKKIQDHGLQKIFDV